MHQLADARGDAAHVAVSGLEPLRMCNLHRLAVTAVPSGADHLAVGGGDDRRSRGRREIRSLVEAGVAEDWVEPLAEARCEPAMDRKADARLILAPDAIGVDPDDVFAVRPFQKLDVGAGDSVEANIQEL